MQVFQKQRSILGGIDEAIAVLKLCAEWEELEVQALYEGDAIAPMETVMTIEGDYSLFAHLETVYLGCLARRSLIMRNVRAVVEAAHGKPILFFPARHDHWLVQTGDGWAAHVAGAIGVSTDAQASWWGGRGVGTVPHGLIAAFGGDTVAAAQAFADRFAGEMNVTVLVDFENDSVRTALEVAEALGDKLWGVRLDTSERMVDRALWERMGAFKPTGVNPELVRLVREALDEAGHRRRPDRRLGRIRRGQDRRVRAARRAGGRLRSRLVAGARRERFHRGRGTSGGSPRRQGGTPVQPEPAAGTRGLGLNLWPSCPIGLQDEANGARMCVRGAAVRRPERVRPGRRGPVPPAGQAVRRAARLQPRPRQGQLPHHGPGDGRPDLRPGARRR